MTQKKRSYKTTREQFLIYLSELENNEDFRENKLPGNKPDHFRHLQSGSLRFVRGQELPEKPLNNLEQRLLHLTENVVIEMLDVVAEIGLPTRKPEREPTEPQPSTLNILQSEGKENEPGNVADTPRGTRVKRTVHKALRQLGTEEQLKKFNANLERIIRQNEEIIKIKKAKLQLQFNVQIDPLTVVAINYRDTE